MLTPQQQGVVAARGREMAVAAGAGSGKTRVLIERILWLITGRTSETELDPGLAEGLDRLLIVTFTRAAAAELRERIDSALEHELARLEREVRQDSAEERQRARRLITHLRQQRTLLPLAQISTIHSFCQRVINQYGAASGLSAERLLSEEDAAQLKHQLATRFIDRQLGRAEDAVLRSAALAWGGRDGVGPSSLSRETGDGGLRKLLLLLHGFQQGLLDAAAWHATQIEAATELDPQRFDPAHPAVSGLLAEYTQWREAALAASAREAEGLAREHPDALHLQYNARRAALLQQAAGGSEWSQPLAALNEMLSRCDGKDGRAELKYKQLAISAYRRDIPEDSAWYARLGQLSDTLKVEAQEWRALFAEPWPEVARRENTVGAWLSRMWQLALDFDGEYRALKAQRQVLDFNDLERGALRLLAAAGAEVAPSEVALELRGRFAEVLVDEYQDVNRLQDAILRLAARELPSGGQARVVVGDIKQSIYGFRQAEPELFRQLVMRLEGGAAGGETYRLRANFRSREGILAAINTLMQGVFTPELGGEDYGRAGSLEYGDAYSFDDSSEQPGARARLHLVIAGAPGEAGVDEGAGEASADEDAAAAEPATDDGGAALALNEQAYHQLAALLRDVHAAGQSPTGYLAERGTQRLRAVNWSDLVVLVRSRPDLSALRIILEQAGIPAQVPSSGSFFEQADVQDALMILRALANPYDSLALAGVLRGPLGRLTSEELLIALYGSRAPLDSQQPGWVRLRAFLNEPDAVGLPYPTAQVEALHARLARLCGKLEEWRGLAARESTSATVWRVLSGAGLLVSAAAAPYGAQRLANLYELHDRALEFDELGRGGLPRLLEYFTAVQAAARDAGELPAAGAAGEGAVRIMTVHQAKGLEFPCVFLPYLHKQFNEQDLRLPVLCNFEAGLAGQHLDLAGPLAECAPGELPALPERKPTLAYRSARRRLRVQLAAEELRLFYVALTRAQERLELITVLKRTELDKLAQVPPPEPSQARRPWDWVWRQLQEELAQALQLGPEQVVHGAGGWQVAVATAPESAEAGEALRRGWAKAERSEADASASQPELSGEELVALSRRLAYSYPYLGSTCLPVKATITGIAKWAEPAGFSHEPPRNDAASLVPAAEPLAPAFMAEQAGDSPLAHGTEVHRLLALLDVTQVLAEPDLAALWEQAGGGALAARYAGKAARMARELAQAFGPWDGLGQARELPVTMAARPDELPGLLAAHEVEPGAGHPGDWVLVQGVLDLLLLWPDRAVVLDYKTDRGLDSGQLRERYGAQLQWYGRAVRELWPHLRVDAITCALYALNGPGLVIL
jgi:ATP-dependent helicase/nuclease subunit A